MSKEVETSSGALACSLTQQITVPWRVPTTGRRVSPHQRLDELDNDCGWHDYENSCIAESDDV